MTFLRGFSFNLAGTGLSAALGFTLWVVLGRVLSKEEFGRMSLLSATILIGAMMLGEWLNRGNTYVVGKEKAGERVVCNTLFYGLGLGVFLLLITAPCAHILRAFFPGIPAMYWWLTAALILLVVVQKGGQAILLGEDRLLLYALLPLLMMFLYLAGVALLSQAPERGVGGVLEAWIAAYGITLIATVAPLWKRGAKMAFHRGCFRRTLAVGGRGGLVAILVFVLFRADNYLVAYWLGEESLGAYRVAKIFAEALQYVPNIAGVVLLPKILRRQDEDHRLSMGVAWGVLCFLLLAAAGLFALGRFLIGLFYPDYTESYLPLVWMLPGLVCGGFGSVLNTKLAGLGYPPVTLWAPALALVLNLGLNSAWIPVLGLKGAALALSLSYGLWALIVTLYYYRYTAKRMPSSAAES